MTSPRLTPLAAAAAATLALCCLCLAAPARGAILPGRLLLQARPAGDSWTRQAFNCSIQPSYTAACAASAPPAPADTVQCQVVNDDKPNIRTAMTCPVRDCTAVCDLVVMQNFFPADLVFATAELLAAWKPATAGC
ncbi:hypothetical protein ABPG75_008180 [Micractinium tetrahymenae]